jgi:hypothetical protein
LAGWNKDGSELRDFLSQIATTDIVNELPLFPHRTPVVDGEFILEDYTRGKLADDKSKVGKPEWVKEIMIGDVAHNVGFSIGLSRNGP